MVIKVNITYVSDLIDRVVLLGGSALSPWALQREPLSVKRRVSEQTGCTGDLEADDISPCLRMRTLNELLQVQLDTPRFMSGFAPFVDGAVLPVSMSQVTCTCFFFVLINSDMRKVKNLKINNIIFICYYFCSYLCYYYIYHRN